MSPDEHLVLAEAIAAELQEAFDAGRELNLAGASLSMSLGNLHALIARAQFAGREVGIKAETAAHLLAPAVGESWADGTDRPPRP